MEAFLTTFGLIFLMEMGDKSQLVIMALATRYRWQQVFLGLLLASAFTHGLAVLVGGLVGNLVPVAYMKTLAAFAFLVFAYVNFRSCSDGEEDCEANTCGLFNRWPALAIAATFFISEFGDKTQLATVASAANTGLPLVTWFGAVAGMVTADSLGIIVGQLLHRIPAWIIKGVSSAVFFIFGWTTLNETWAIGRWWNYLGLIPLIIGVWLIWRQRTQVTPKTTQQD